MRGSRHAAVVAHIDLHDTGIFDRSRNPGDAAIWYGEPGSTKQNDRLGLPCVSATLVRATNQGVTSGGRLLASVSEIASFTSVLKFVMNRSVKKVIAESTIAMS